MNSIEKKGVIVAHYGVEVDVRFGDKEEPKRIGVKRKSGHVVGDSVLVTDGVLTRLPRTSELFRKDARGGLHNVGANIDVLCIVVSCEPLAPSNFIDRAIIAARAAAIIPILVVNKSDLDCFSSYFDELYTAYNDSVEIFSMSASTGANVDGLVKLFAKGYRGVFVGTTGVGKSSILNKILPSLDLQTGVISETKKRGRHTTTVSTLHRLQDGGELIDSPGFNDFGLVDITVAELSAHFPGFETIDDSPCKFRDCLHRNDPGCSVVQCVTENTISISRYKVYLQLLDEVESLAQESQYRLSRNRRKK